MPLFRRRRARTDGGAVVSDRAAAKAELDALRDFATSRSGVEAFIEPRTSVTQTTLLLVAADGEWTRRRIPSADAGATFARKLEIPVYDTNRVGYPQRMRDWNVRQQQSRSTTKEAAPRKVASASELKAIMTLETIAGTDPLPDNPPRDQLEKVWRRARSLAHPDRRGGDRSQWDQVEDAARALGLDHRG